jgi:hypothetical protein
LEVNRQFSILLGFRLSAAFYRLLSAITADDSALRKITGIARCCAPRSAMLPRRPRNDFAPIHPMEMHLLPQLGAAAYRIGQH